MATKVVGPGATASALTAAYARKFQVNVLDYGAVADWNGTTGTDNTAAFTNALAATPAGGKVLIPPGAYWLASDFPPITKPVEMAGQSSGLGVNTVGTQLVLAAGKNGPSIPQSALAAGWYVHDLELQSLSTAAGTDVGFFAGGGFGTLKRVTAIGFGSHGVHFKAGSGFGGGNVNNSLIERARAYANFGDGIRVEGSDANVVLLLKPSVVANYGWGINLERPGACKVVSPHAEQVINGSPGAFRDNGNGNDWDWVYSESGVQFYADSLSTGARISCSTMGNPVINTFSAAVGLSVRVEQDQGARNLIQLRELGAGKKLWRLVPGSFGSGSFDLIQQTDSLRILTVDGAASRVSWYVDQRPTTDGTKNLGSASLRWLNGFFSSYVRVGAVATGSRPSAATAGAGAVMYDSTLGKPIWSNGTAWRDAMGTAV